MRVLPPQYSSASVWGKTRPGPSVEHGAHFTPLSRVVLGLSLISTLVLVLVLVLVLLSLQAFSMFLSFHPLVLYHIVS